MRPPTSGSQPQAAAPGLRCHALLVKLASGACKDSFETHLKCTTSKTRMGWGAPSSGTHNKGCHDIKSMDPPPPPAQQPPLTPFSTQAATQQALCVPLLPRVLLLLL